MEKTKKEEAPKSDAISAEEARNNRLLVMEDISKYKQLQAQLRMKIAEYDVYIAECETALADLDRREAGVMYPPPPNKPAPAPAPAPVTGKPQMGAPVGGK